MKEFGRKVQQSEQTQSLHDNSHAGVAPLHHEIRKVT